MDRETFKKNLRAYLKNKVNQSGWKYYGVWEGDYVYCESEKIRRGCKQVIRKMPVSPMLKRVFSMIDFDLVKRTNKSTIRDALKRVFPERHIHEFRYTFITRAKECEVNPEVVMLWAGHESDSDV